MKERIPAERLAPLFVLTAILHGASVLTRFDAIAAQIPAAAHGARDRSISNSPAREARLQPRMARILMASTSGRLPARRRGRRSRSS
jgi:hypothetical protein